jgi:hypothetical protein
MMTPTPTASVAGALFIADQLGQRDVSMYWTAVASHWLYSHDRDAYMQIPSGAFAGTAGAGNCGIYHPWSINYTANGGSTTTVTVLSTTHNITGLAKGSTIEFISSGTNSGLRRKVVDVITNAGAGNVTLTLDSAVPTAVLNTHTFRLATGRFYVMNAGTVATGSWKVFDVATLAWQANLATTNLPATWGTDGKLASAYAVGANSNITTGTATSGGSTSLTDTTKTWAVDQWTNYKIQIIGGTGIGQVRTIQSNTPTVLTVSSAWTTQPDATSVYAVLSEYTYAVGLATAGASTTLTNSAKTWTVNQWTNYQVRIASGTGIGQVRTIASNTATVLTVGTAWTTTPDATSVYVIEGNEDFLYLLGNNAVTMYRYSISANTWTVMAPTTARAAAPILGMSADVVIKTRNSVWADESNIQEGRYIYSVRGGTAITTGALIDRFDIAGGTAGAGAWANVVYQGTEFFSGGSNACVDGKYIYLKKDNTHRFFRYDILGNYIEPLSTIFNQDSSALVGQKLWVKNLDSTGTVKWLYSLGNSLTTVYRLMLY